MHTFNILSGKIGPNQNSSNHKVRFASMFTSNTTCNIRVHVCFSASEQWGFAYIYIKHCENSLKRTVVFIFRLRFVVVSKEGTLIRSCVYVIPYIYLWEIVSQAMGDMFHETASFKQNEEFVQNYVCIALGNISTKRLSTSCTTA